MAVYATIKISVIANGLLASVSGPSERTHYFADQAALREGLPALADEGINGVYRMYHPVLDLQAAAQGGGNGTGHEAAADRAGDGPEAVRAGG